MSFGSFFTFDRLITPSILRVVFWLGLVVIVAQWIPPIIGSVSATLGGNARGLIGILVTLLLFAVSAVLWRIICEVLVVLFDIRDRLVSLDGKTRQQ